MSTTDRSSYTSSILWKSSITMQDEITISYNKNISSTDTTNPTTPRKTNKG